MGPLKYCGSQVHLTSTTTTTTTITVVVVAAAVVFVIVVFYSLEGGVCHSMHVEVKG